MRFKDCGCDYVVYCSENDVNNFKAMWPCSGLNGRVAFRFKKSTGDLVDYWPQTHKDDEALVALSADVQQWALSNGKIEE